MFFGTTANVPLWRTAAVHANKAAIKIMTYEE
jgi:hypothetical protein